MPYEIGYCTYQQDPELVSEIISERSMAYKAVYGCPADKDQYDEIYSHIYVVTKSDRRIVACYRIATMQEVVAQFGLQGLYTYSLFEYDQRLLEQMGPSFEIGRMFIAPEYQRDFHSFAMLWRGVGRFIVDHPGRRYLIGAVNLDANYSRHGCAMIEAYCKSIKRCEAISGLVEPRVPFPGEVIGAEKLASIRSLNDLSKYLKATEPSHRGLPTLLKKYRLLDASFLQFAHNTKLSTVDVLTMVKLNEMPAAFINRLLGADRAQQIFQSVLE